MRTIKSMLIIVPFSSMIIGPMIVTALATYGGWNDVKTELYMALSFMVPSVICCFLLNKLMPRKG